VPPYETGFVKRVVMFMIIGALLMAATVFDYRRPARLLAVHLRRIGHVAVVGADPRRGREPQRHPGWFQLGPFQLQPSELAKLGMIIGFAGPGVAVPGDLDTPGVDAAGLCGLPMGLVMLQPDLGTTLVSVAVSFALLLVAGVRPRVLGVLALGAVVVTTLVLTSGVLKEYQVARLTTYVRQDQEVTSERDEETRYNLDQAKLAIGSGGLTGKGLFQGTQTNNSFVPEQRTDFIFTAVGEQLGFVGCAALLTGLGVIVWRVWRTAQLARDDFGMLLCTGIMVMIVIQS
jgi:rod shape determining protein RodA